MSEIRRYQKLAESITDNSSCLRDTCVNALVALYKISEHHYKQDEQFLVNWLILKMKKDMEEE